jgi:hypothetical protein
LALGLITFDFDHFVGQKTAVISPRANSFELINLIPYALLASIKVNLLDFDD